MSTLSNPSNIFTSIFGSLYVLLNLALLVTTTICIVYSLILFIKLAKRAIKALEIYIDKHKEDM